jgi:plastocyanin
VSGVDGIASITRTLGPNAGVQTTTATRTGLAGSPITFNAVATIQGATQIALAVPSGNNQTDTVLAPLATPYAVLVRDHNNAPIAGVTVTWTAPAGTIIATGPTNASGIATATRTLGATAGAQTAQAAVTGLIGSPVTFTATANAGNAAALEKTSGDAGTGGINTTVVYTVTVRDGHGNPKAGQQVNWEVASGGGSISPTDNVTAANGQASGTRTLSGTEGVHTARAIAPNNLPTPDTVTFTTTATSLATTANVAVNDNVFSPDSVRIAVGGTVTFDWGAGGGTHNVTFANVAGAPADIPDRASGAVDRTFGTAGTFNYQCTIHPTTMNGKVVAQ